MRAREATKFLIALSMIAEGARAEAGEPAVSPVPAVARQLLLVRTPAWTATKGTLERYERPVPGGWERFGAAVPVAVGRRGMGWGRGLYVHVGDGPTKREGDGRSPAGVFALGSAFGRAAELPAKSHGYAYLQTQSSTYCVEDVRSARYNQVIDAARVSGTRWEQWSAMRRADGLFNWGVIVRQNSPDVMVGAGSCVFLHIWRHASSPTSGCTAMPAKGIEETIRWLDADASPVLVQLPEPEFQRLREVWGLP